MELKQNAGVIFKNDRKQRDSHPDYKGEIDVNGERFEIALWVKEGKKGKFFSASISEPYQKPIDKEQIHDDTPRDENDSLPF